MLPPVFAASLAVYALPTRGLAAVKTSVVDAARKLATPHVAPPTGAPASHWLWGAVAVTGAVMLLFVVGSWLNGDDAKASAACIWARSARPAVYWDKIKDL